MCCFDAPSPTVSLLVSGNSQSPIMFWSNHSADFLHTMNHVGTIFHHNNTDCVTSIYLQNHNVEVCLIVLIIRLIFNLKNWTAECDVVIPHHRHWPACTCMISNMSSAFIASMGRRYQALLDSNYCTHEILISSDWPSPFSVYLSSCRIHAYYCSVGIMSSFTYCVILFTAYMYIW